MYGKGEEEEDKATYALVMQINARARSRGMKWSMIYALMFGASSYNRMSR